ncbi:hypothetical protein [Streptomyces lydicus]|uniref:hypothetical protein n=1 Tax=Streptomyces lydicus TaxID=47763 RepID=UPI0034467E78
MLIRRFREVSRDNGDQLSWLLASFLQADSDRRNRWSAALVSFCVGQQPGNEEALRRWIRRWTPIADEAAAGLGGLLQARPERGRDAGQVAAGARAAREAFHAEVFGGLR